MDLSGKLKFLEKLLGQSKYSNNTKEAEFFCCFCSHHKPKLSINLGTDNWKCWVCGKNGTRLLYVINKVGSRQDIQTYLEKYSAKEIQISKEDLDFTLDFPKDYSFILGCLNSVAARHAYKYLQGRSVSDDDILRYKIGVSTVTGNLILPSFDKRGHINFFTTRDISKVSTGYYQPEVPRGYKNTIILNELNVDWTKPVVLVEGFFDMLKSIPNTIPLFGSSMYRASLLMQSIADAKVPIILALDPDALEKAMKIAALLRGFANVNVSYVDVAPFKDVGEMTKEEFKSKLEKAIPLNEVQILRQKMRLVC